MDNIYTGLAERFNNRQGKAWMERFCGSSMKTRNYYFFVILLLISLYFNGFIDVVNAQGNDNLSPVKRICVFEHSVMTNFNCACPAIQRGQGSGFLSEGSS